MSFYDIASRAVLMVTLVVQGLDSGRFIACSFGAPVWVALTLGAVLAYAMIYTFLQVVRSAKS